MSKKGKVIRTICIGNAILLIGTLNTMICLSECIVPPQGGGMIHCDPQMTDNIRLPVPTQDVGIAWYSHSKGGELFGTWGNGIAGNGRIAACPFSNYFGRGNLIIYDYDGHQLWVSGQAGIDAGGLNFFATASTPLVDINDQVIACDSQRIILINASNHSKIHVQWDSPIRYHNETGIYPIPYSPSILGNNTIILPLQKGPLLAFNAKTGAKIAEIKLGFDGINETYYGFPDMPLSDFQLIKNTTKSPYHYDSENHTVKWVSNIFFGIIPSNSIFQENNIAFITRPDGNVTAFNILNGTELASNPVASPELLSGPDYYSTINSACITGNRVFLACEKKGDAKSRLYAVDVNTSAENDSQFFHVAWYYDYFGKSQATPTLIGDTIYFDGYNDTSREHRDPHIYAVSTNGTEKWKISYPNMTWFSFAKDPRGGFWYEDCDQVQFGSDTGGNKLVHFSEEYGSIIEEIDMKILLNDTGPNKDLPVLPSSDMTTCGTSAHPVMLISANHQWFHEGKWIIAINLSDNNSALWKVNLDSTLLSSANYANGQYTILMKGNEPRILICTWLGGVIAIGVPLPPPPLPIIWIIILSIIISAIVISILEMKKRRISRTKKKR